MPGTIRVGIGGWTFEPWRGIFYPDKLPHKQELAFASRALTAIEINGTYYSTFKPKSWTDWREATPDNFVFTVKASRYATNRKVLADAGPSVKRFLEQGLTELGPKLGPVVWQFMPTKKFDADDFGAFLALLPAKQDGVVLRHAIEVRHTSFMTPEFLNLARASNVAIVAAESLDYPEIDEPSGGFTYARLMSSHDDIDAGLTDAELSAIAKRAKAWTKSGDVFVFFIAGAKVRNPAAAIALQQKLKIKR